MGRAPPGTLMNNEGGCCCALPALT